MPLNCLVVLPVSAMVRPLPVPEGGVLDIAAALLFAAVIIPIFFVRDAYMSRRAGVLMLLAYAAYMTFRATQ